MARKSEDASLHTFPVYLKDHPVDVDSRLIYILVRPLD